MYVSDTKTSQLGMNECVYLGQWVGQAKVMHGRLQSFQSHKLRGKFIEYSRILVGLKRIYRIFEFVFDSTSFEGIIEFETSNYSKDGGH